MNHATFQVFILIDDSTIAKDIKEEEEEEKFNYNLINIFSLIIKLYSEILPQNLLYETQRIIDGI